MEMWLKVVVLSVGGSLGVNARYWLGVWMSRWTSPQFPWATFTINVSGSFLIGFLTVAVARWLPHPNFRLLVITGFLGGYTTFSTFENDSLTLWERGEGLLVALNVVGSVALGLLAVMLGTALGRGPSAPAEESVATESRAVEATIARIHRPPDQGDGRPIDTVSGRAQAVGDLRSSDEGSTR
jgi:fluoride exporter